MEGYQAHETAVIDEGCQIGQGTRIWHFSHLMAGCVVGERCNIGQNVVVSPGVVLGDGVKVQNNGSIYTGVICEDEVFLGPSCVFTNALARRNAETFNQMTGSPKVAIAGLAFKIPVSTRPQIKSIEVT